MTRRAWTLAAAAGIGVALLAWTIVSVGPRELASQLARLASILPFILLLSGVRFLCQAIGWQIALRTSPERARHGRVDGREAFAAVVAGEAAGYFTWGPVSREPMKAFLIEHRVPQRDGLAAAVIERSLYSMVATALIISSVGVMAFRFDHLNWFVIAMTVVAIAGLTARKHWKRLAGKLVDQPAALAAILATGIVQELTNLLEAYTVMSWLGASPSIEAVVALEGAGRLLNSAGQFIPGKLGISEAASASLADLLHLGAAHGLGLALARRVRSLIWGAVGIGFVVLRAAQTKWQTA